MIVLCPGSRIIPFLYAEKYPKPMIVSEIVQRANFCDGKREREHDKWDEFERIDNSNVSRFEDVA